VKKKLTIKNVLTELSHIEARLYNLRQAYLEKGIIIKDDDRITSGTIPHYLHKAIEHIGNAETEIKEWIEPNMLK
jgi:hypothetical protein